MKINRSRISVAFMLVVSSALFAQNNLPVDMVLVEGGDYGIQVYDSVSNITKTYFSKEMDSFYMSATEVSVQDFKTFCKETNRKMPPEPDWGWGDPKLPVVDVTYTDALQYCAWLTEIHGIPFTLPTPQQWEYAARAGNFDTDDFVYNQELPNPYVVYIGNSKEKPNCITCMQPNEIGLYAMCGNVWEWTLMELENRWGPPVMGGSFFEDAEHVQVTTRKEFPQSLRRQDIGFRVVVNMDN